MDIFDYQTQLRNFVDYNPGLSPYYPILGIYEELGRLSEKLRIALKEKDANFSDKDIQKINISLGDIIFYITCMCNDLGIKLDDVLNLNIRKQNLIKQRELDEKLRNKGIKPIS